MSMVDIYRNNIARKKIELAKLESDRSNETKKIPALNNKIISANKSLSTAKSSSTIQSKLREIERAQAELARIDKKVADINVKIARKNKELLEEEKKYRNEEAKENKKRQEMENKRNRENMLQMQKVENTLRAHATIQSQLQQSIIDLSKIPEKITVLFIASNPIDTDQLRLDEEARVIQEMIRKSDYRDSVNFVTRWAARTGDILQAINEVNPDVIHFSGHGSDSDELVLQDNSGAAKFVSLQAIVQVIMATSDKIRLVYFNTCYSYSQAEAVIEHVEAAIGMTTSIGDDAARIFAAQFYSAIGFGFSLRKAFEQAKAALMLEGIEEENTPELYIQNGLNAEEIILVHP